MNVLYTIFSAIFLLIVLIYMIIFDILNSELTASEQLMLLTKKTRGIEMQHQNINEIQTSEINKYLYADIDANIENCTQLIVQICMTIVNECGTQNDALKTWSWALSSVGGDLNALEQDIDYIITNNKTITGGDKIKIGNIPQNTTIGSCDDISGLIQKGRYLLNLYKKVVNCDDYYLNLNGISNKNICSG